MQDNTTCKRCGQIVQIKQTNWNNGKITAGYFYYSCDNPVHAQNEKFAWVSDPQGKPITKEFTQQVMGIYNRAPAKYRSQPNQYFTPVESKTTADNQMLLEIHEKLEILIGLVKSFTGSNSLVKRKMQSIAEYETDRNAMLDE